MNRTALIAWSPDTGTTEMPRFRRGVPLAEQPTEPAGFPWALPAPAAVRCVRPRWSWLARGIAALVVVNVAGLIYVAVTW